MTEQEAKLKPCIGSAPQNTGELWNPGSDGVTRFGCAGSTCMAWLWQRGRGDGPTEEIDAADRLSLPDRPGFEWHAANSLGTAIMGLSQPEKDKTRYGLFPRIGHCGWIKP